jgi:kelch-like protein 10
MGLPNVYDYIHKHRERLMEEKRQKLLAHEVRRNQHQQQEQEQMRQNTQIGSVLFE